MKNDKKKRINPLSDQEKYIKNLMFTSVSLIKDSEFEEYNLKNKNLMFFLNCVSDKLSSISMIGNRNLGNSLIGKTLVNFKINNTNSAIAERANVHPKNKATTKPISNGLTLTETKDSLARRIMAFIG